MKYGLHSKLSLSYAVLALLLVAVISLCINIFFKIQFNDYVIEQQKQNNQSIINLVEKQYNTGTGNWNESAVENIGMSALEQGIILKVKDNSGNTVWDATIHNNGLCTQMLSQMAAYTQSHNLSVKGGYEQTSYSLTANFKKVGEAEIGYYGPYYYTNNDVLFLNSINTILVVVGFVSLLMALLLGAVMSKRISRPISKAIQAASEISKGNFKQRIEEKSSTKEINQLTDTVNGLADSLEKQESLRKTMAADVSHELRTPLASLQSSLEAMIDGIWQPTNERLESCHEEILRINRLVGDLEKLERAEAENAVLNISEFDISDLTEHIIHNFETDFYKKGVELNFKGEAVLISADRDKISQVIINLVSNALKYTPKEGRVDVDVKGTERSVEVTVKDNGNGIPSEDIPNIFERFYRADKSRNRLTGGSGLGLTITKAIVEAHKGKISVSSELNKETIFTVNLPKKNK
jgi:signal transduction histidine kinase